MIGYPYSYGDILTPEIARNNRKQTVSYSVFIVTLWLYILGLCEPIQSYSFGGKSETAISRVLEQKSPSMRQEGSVQPEQALKGTQGAQTALKIPSGGSDKFSAGSKAKGAARRDFARRRNKGKSSGSIFAQGFFPQRQYGSRPAAANRLAQQFQSGPAKGGNGLFGRFSARPTPNPYNPGCAGGPRSITVVSGQRNSDLSTNLTAHDGFKAKLTNKSENHLTSKHGHKFGVDDPLPPNPNQKPTKYKRTRTRLNNENKAKVREEIKSILSNPKSDVYTDVSISRYSGPSLSLQRH